MVTFIQLFKTYKMTPLKLISEKVEISNIRNLYGKYIYIYGLYGVYIRRRKSHIRFGPTLRICACTHPRMCAHLHSRTPASAHIHARKPVCTDAHTKTHVRAKRYMHAHLHMYAHAHIHA